MKKIIYCIAKMAKDPEIENRWDAVEHTYEKKLSEIAGITRLKEELEEIVGVEKAKKILADMGYESEPKYDFKITTPIAKITEKIFYIAPLQHSSEYAVLECDFAFKARNKQIIKLKDLTLLISMPKVRY
jgi:hypothetical protein